MSLVKEEKIFGNRKTLHRFLRQGSGESLVSILSSASLPEVDSTWTADYHVKSETSGRRPGRLLDQLEPRRWRHITWDGCSTGSEVQSWRFQVNYDLKIILKWWCNEELARSKELVMHYGNQRFDHFVAKNGGVAQQEGTVRPHPSDFRGWRRKV